MATTETFGPNEAKRGDKLSNGGHEERWTCPGCYTDFFDEDTTECDKCGAPIECTIEMVPTPYCTIRDADDAED